VTRLKDALTNRNEECSESKLGYLEKANGKKLSHSLSNYKRNYTSKYSQRSNSQRSEPVLIVNKVERKRISILQRETKCYTPVCDQLGNQSLDIHDTEEVSSAKPKSIPYISNNKSKKFVNKYAVKFTVIPKDELKKHKKKT
jgi:hypothetical protein